MRDLKRRQYCAITPIASDRQIVEAQIGQRAAQLALGRYDGVGLGHLAEGVVAQIQPPALQHGATGCPAAAMSFANRSSLKVRPS